MWLWWVASYLGAAGLFYAWIYTTAKWDPSGAPAYDGVEELQTALPDLIARLPSKEQRVIQGRFQESLSYNELSEQLGMKRHQLMNIEANIRMGCAILKHYYDREKKDVRKALARYNGSVGRREYPDLVIGRWTTRWRS